MLSSAAEAESAGRALKAIGPQTKMGPLDEIAKQILGGASEKRAAIMFTQLALYLSAVAVRVLGTFQS